MSSKLLLVVPLLVLFIFSLPGADRNEKGKGNFIKLVELKPTCNKAGITLRRPGTASFCSVTRIINGKECKETIFAHATSLVEFDIPSNVKYFTAYGVGAKHKNPRYGVYAYIVKIDNKEVFRSHSIRKYDDELLEIKIPIPKGSKKIQLITDRLGSTDLDHSTWCYPRFLTKSVVKRSKSNPITVKVKGLDITENQVLKEMKSYFPIITRSKLKDGTPQALWKTDDDLTYLEILGDSHNIKSAGLIMALPKDNKSVVLRTTVISLIFLKNTNPKWKRSSDWFTTTLDSINKSDKSSIETIVNGKKISMGVIKEMGMLTLSVERLK